MSNSTYRYKLLKKVIDLSEGSEWDSAVKEWEIDGVEEDEDCSSTCVCGKENLRYLFTIQNSKNGNTLFPIGSSCIKKFGRSDLSEETGVLEKLFQLYHAIENGEFITLSPDFFSRKLLAYLYEKDVFQPSRFNHYDGENDYDFLLKMFNKRDKTSITQLQQKKINAIIMTSIRPYLEAVVQNRIRKGNGQPGKAAGKVDTRMRYAEREGK